MGDAPGALSKVMPTCSNTADAWVVFRRGKQRRLAKKVPSPGLAWSIPATPVISVSCGPSTAQPSLRAISDSFMNDSPDTSASLAQRQQRSIGGHRRIDGGELQRRAITIARILQINRFTAIKRK